MTRSNRGADISLFPALLLTFRSLLMYRAQIPLCVTASGASGSSCFWGKDVQWSRCFLRVGCFRLARLTTDSCQGEESLHLCLPGAGFLLLAKSGIWQSEVLWDLISSRGREGLLWHCSSGLSLGSVGAFWPCRCCQPCAGSLDTSLQSKGRLASPQKRGLAWTQRGSLVLHSQSCSLPKRGDCSLSHSSKGPQSKGSNWLSAQR